MSQRSPSSRPAPPARCSAGQAAVSGTRQDHPWRFPRLTVQEHPFHCSRNEVLDEMCPDFLFGYLGIKVAQMLDLSNRGVDLVHLEDAVAPVASPPKIVWTMCSRPESLGRLLGPGLGCVVGAVLLAVLVGHDLFGVVAGPGAVPDQRPGLRRARRWRPVGYIGGTLPLEFSDQRVPRPF
ncbi:hypothetical protein TIFTF001_044804 [Ficus carica]|uniref:Uncharacterized protein n=1 Tax=Ficus carica TaxID=3494 RepID=A0AA87ZWZ0_FICCA|nr:hypothetical protein TIFTF001_044804 [Ficus carica]